MNTNNPMNENTPEPTDTAWLPEPPSAADNQPTVSLGAEGLGESAHATTDSSAGEPDGEKRGGVKRPVLTGLAIAAAVLLVGGAGVAIGVSATNDRNSAAVVSESSEAAQRGEPDAEAAEDPAEVPGGVEVDGGPERNEAPEGPSGPESGSTPADADSLISAIDSAVAAVSGAGATSVEVERDGWEVEVQLADGTSSEVFVALDRTATVRDTDSDRDNDPLLDASKVSAIVDAALAAAVGGTIESISTDNGTVRYDVSVDLGNGNDVEVELSETLEVLNVDRD